MKELEKTYNPADIEDRLYQKWLDGKYFHAKVNKDKKPFTIVMPPPNITGQLHMGHALDETMQDILIRFKRMQGYEALCLQIEKRERVDLVAPIFQAYRIGSIRSEDVQDTAALRKLPGSIDLSGALISTGKERGNHLFHGDALPG